MTLHAVVLAGGTGSRLWPFSTPAHPKQFQPILSDLPLVRLAVERARRIAGDNVWVVTDAKYVEQARDLCAGVAPERVLGEPSPKGTLGAVLLAAAAVAASDPDGVLVVLPSDHVVEDEDEIARTARALVPQIVEDAIGLIATPVSAMHPAFGHVRPGTKAHGDASGCVWEVAGYIEKPDPDAPIAGGPWHRNMGIVIGRAAHLATLDGATSADAATSVIEGGSASNDAWAEIVSQRIEDAVLPTCTSLLVGVASVAWTDVGTWGALFERVDASDSAGVHSGAGSSRSSTGNVVLSSAQPVHVIGIDDALVVCTPEMVVVCARHAVDRLEGLRSTTPDA
jgi:mannose-1-phosphate guanylyltransferase